MRALLLAVAALAAAPLAPPGTLTDARAATPVKAWGGLAAWTSWDPRERLVRIQVLQNGAMATLPGPVAPLAAGPIDLDLGPDSRNRPLYVLGVGGRLQVVDGITHRVRALPPPPAGARDGHPTAWRGRLAWARTTAAGEQVLTGPDPGDDAQQPGAGPGGAAAGSGTSAAGPGDVRPGTGAVGAGTAGAGAGTDAAGAAPLRGRTVGGLVRRGEHVAELELAGTRLASVTTSATAATTTLRVADLGTGSVRTIARAGGGRLLTGASFVRGTLRFVVSCPAGAACRGDRAAWAYDIASDSYARAPESGEAVGWAALPSGGAVQAGAVSRDPDAPAALGCFDPRSSPAAFSCPVRPVAPQRYAVVGERPASLS